MTTESGKQYGLLLPKKGSNKDIIQRPSVFDEGSDSEDSGTGKGDWIKKAYQREANKSLEKRQTKIQVQKALSQDPSIYQYDEVYDEIKDKINKTPVKKEEKKQSRYIQSLKRNAERRKLENERRLERQVQKERLKEGDEFKDKETFVTSSYKKKLEEFQKMDEEEKRMDRLEEIGDVSKQKDISGFYRHLYKTTVDVDQHQNKKDQDNKMELEEKVEIVKKSPTKEINEDQFNPLSSHKKQKRQYRKRTKSGSSREEGEKTTSSSSSSSSTSSSDSDSERRSKSHKKRKEENSQSKEKTPDKKKISTSQNRENIEVSQKSSNEMKENRKPSSSLTNSSTLKDVTVNEIETDSINRTYEETKPTVNIWLKRTVGALFDDALQRYLERKSKR
ncbi:nuclear speckle splicing regulatory protein 1 [Homalodisca vitripennis]|uniref:nuclear speckle splicing regulatory protein 1 n=1 Tax=Homalodisca vitripennis TaxID=197043 RepID=UPI001EEB7A6C|nr:nuclear speckle splicing regulatory protein 1 [Homalodisca vitripennis]